MAGLAPTNSSKEITVDQMDYGYIDECSNEKELERILRALKSGSEGIYPDLIEHCEKKLQSVNPHSRVLRKQQPILTQRDLGPEERQDLTNEMDEWVGEMKDSDAPTNGSASVMNGFGYHDDLPPIRGSEVLKGSKKKKLGKGDGKNANPERIKSYDYKAWDKFDVDKECHKIEKESEEPITKRTNINLPDEINASGLGEEERKLKAMKEKEKGNEAFKSGDFEEALTYYCRSISLQPIAASYNNRALVYLRLERWQDARNDCDTVLGFDGESGNLKAMLRRASACKALGFYDEAKADLMFVLEKEPNNARAKSILGDVEKLEAAREKKKKEDSQDDKDEVKPAKSGKKMVIQEVDGDSDEEDGDQKPAVNPAAKSVAMDVGNSLEASKPTDSAKSDQKDALNLDAKASESPLKTNAEASESALDREEKDENPPGTIVWSPPVDPKFPASTEKLKVIAGNFFRSGRYAEACEQYTKAINSLSKLLKSKDVDKGHELANAVLHNNRAACWLKQGNDKACIEDCTKVLEVKTWDGKAFVRRAVAYEHMEKYSLAWADYQSAYNMDRNNALAQNGANRVAKHLRETHGAGWREKMPKVPHYPHLGSATWVAPSDHSISTQPQAKSNSKVPPAVQNNTAISGNTEKAETGQNGVSEEETSKSPESSSSSMSSPKETKMRPNEQKSGSTNLKKTKNSRKRNKSKSKSGKKATTEEKTTSPEKDQADVEEKRLKIRRDLYEKFKADGNNFVKNGDYTSAIDCYTKCLTYCPKEPASYTNRALCFLKLKKHLSAVNDCTEAIRLDPVNVKAYYRRALARKSEGYYKDAERDIKKLIEIDPGNKTALNELENLKKVAWDSARAKDDSKQSKSEMKKGMPQKKQLIIKEVNSSSSSDEGEFILPNDEPEVRKKSPTKCQDEGVKASAKDIPGDEKPNVASQGKSAVNKLSEKKDVSPQKESRVDNDSLKSRELPKSKVPKSAAASKESSSTSPRPTSNHLSPYEFGNAWNSIADKENIEDYKVLIDPVEPKDLPMLISNKIDDHVILVVARIALEYAQRDGNYQRAYNLMHHLTEAKRFSMAAMFLTDPQQEPLRDVFKILDKHSGCTFKKDDLTKLKDLYCLS